MVRHVLRKSWRWTKKWNMSKASKSDLYRIVNEITLSLNHIIEKKYATLQGSQGSIRDAEREELKKEAIKSVKDLSSSVNNKIELLTCKLMTITSFNWDILHNFKYHQDPSKNNNMVAQSLLDGAFVVLCSEQDTMKHFIFTEIAAFFSNISGIIDNVALLIKYSFRLDFKKDDILLNDVYDLLDDCSVKDFLINYTKEKYNFWGMRTVRKACEHKDLTDVFFYGEKAGLVTRDLGLPYINSDIRNVDPEREEENRIDIYCEFLYEKMADFLRGLAVALSNSNK